ncbi:MAG: hypothetical protein M0T70_12405 [Geobacteraceae bacterium]|nr:hypothetical protein [Geobacteraceae bacterium]
MKQLLLIFTLLVTVISGCAQNHFNVPTENFADKVRVLGVVPIIVDVDSDIRHPQKDQLIQLLTEMNRKYEQHLVRKLKDTGNFDTVALLDGDPQNIYAKLYSRREQRDDASIQYNKYFWKNDELRNYIQKNNLDAVMLIVVSGLTKSDKVTSIGQLKSLVSDYNYLIMTAQILDANGTILWEYPNFRQSPLNYEPLVNLEYPDFNEAEANLTTSTNVNFKTIEGIRRIFDQKQKDLLLRETQESQVYGKQFDDMVSLLKYDHDKNKKTAAPAVATPQEQQPAVTTPPPAPAAASPSTPAPAVEVPAVTRVPVLEKSTTPSDEIVPAKGSTL